MKLSSLLERIEYQCIQGSTDTEITSLVNDSRKASPGCVYICIRGASFDGHAFIGEVAAKGAAAFVVEELPEQLPEGACIIQVKDTRYAMAFIAAAWYGYPAEQLKTIGITGTKGKTTTTYMVKSILENAGYKVGLIGTIETIIGEKRIPAANTTPESVTIQEYFTGVGSAVQLQEPAPGTAGTDAEPEASLVLCNRRSGSGYQSLRTGK